MKKLLIHGSDLKVGDKIVGALNDIFGPSKQKERALRAKELAEAEAKALEPLDESQAGLFEVAE